MNCVPNAYMLLNDCGYEYYGCFVTSGVLYMCFAPGNRIQGNTPIRAGSSRPSDIGVVTLNPSIGMLPWSWD